MHVTETLTGCCLLKLLNVPCSYALTSRRRNTAVLHQGMIDTLNAVPVTHVCFGNHENDVPLKAQLRRCKQFNGTWLNTNMSDTFVIFSFCVCCFNFFLRTSTYAEVHDINDATPACAHQRLDYPAKPGMTQPHEILDVRSADGVYVTIVGH